MEHWKTRYEVAQAYINIVHDQEERVFEQTRIKLPDRKRFKLEVQTKQSELEAQAGSRQEIQAARRTAVIALLSRYGLIDWRGDVSTNSKADTVTN